MYIYIYTHIYIYIHTHNRPHRNSHRYAYINIYIHSRARAHTHTHTHTVCHAGRVKVLLEQLGPAVHQKIQRSLVAHSHSITLLNPHVSFLLSKSSRQYFVKFRDLWSRSDRSVLHTRIQPVQL